MFWHPKGWTLYRTLQNYMRRRLDAAGYVEVKTPQVLDRSALGDVRPLGEVPREHVHCATAEEQGAGAEADELPRPRADLPSGHKSYRDLPLRMAEFGACHRYEPSGALHGLMRVRAFTQDDAHIFCTRGADHRGDAGILRPAHESVYRDLGFDDVTVKFSDRPEKRAGTDEIWDKAEAALADAATAAAGLETALNPGRGRLLRAEARVRRCATRSAATGSCGTLQVDFVLPERLDAELRRRGRRTSTGR